MTSLRPLSHILSFDRLYLRQVQDANNKGSKIQRENGESRGSELSSPPSIT